MAGGSSVSVDAHEIEAEGGVDCAFVVLNSNCVTPLLKIYISGVAGGRVIIPLVNN